jgi:hypothetical protein
MDQRYQRFYRGVYAARANAPEAGERSLSRPAGSNPEWSEVVGEAILAAEATVGRPIRDDGRAFLAVNFQDLILAPLEIAGEAPREQLYEDVRADIVSIVRAADQDGPIELSGHALVNALARSWDQLRVTRYGIWEQ